MQVDFWVSVTATKDKWGLHAGVPKASKNKPSIGPMTVPIKLSLEIPDSYFELPELSAHISLPEVRDDNPQVKVEMQQRIAQNLKDSLGVNVTFTEE